MTTRIGWRCVPAVAFDVTQVQKAQAKTPVALVVGEPDQPLGDLGVFLSQLGLVAVAGLADAKRLAGQANADTTIRNRGHGHLTPVRWP